MSIPKGNGIMVVKQTSLLFAILMLFLGAHPASGATTPVLGTYPTDGLVSLKSHGFNAKKRSSFTINGITEHINRGLTIIHFYSSEDFEFKTFDTYGSEEAAAEFVKVLAQIRKDKATCLVLAHDSASRSLQKFSATLKKIGFEVLSQLANRQAYAAHNLSGELVEKVNDLSISLELSIPENIQKEAIYFPKPSWDFEPSNDRFIAHAGGEVEGVKSTNSKEALDENYKRGFRLFELDIIETSDGYYVAAHDWKMWARFTDYSGPLPPSHSEFQKRKIYGKYQTLDMDGINQWFAKHKDAILITDKVDDPVRFANQFVFKRRLIMELFSPLAIEEAASHGIEAMISQEPLAQLKGDKMKYLAINNIKYVAVSRRIIASQTDLLIKLKEQGLKVYVYNVNFDPGKDEKYVLENEIGLVYGMYADKWVFNPDNIAAARSLKQKTEVTPQGSDR